MSRVFVAHEVALGRRVVVKVLLPELAAGVSVDRFRREIQLAAQLQHPHIVPLLSAGESDGLPYFTMPFIDGETLGVKLARTGELPVSETVRILRDIASALAYAHEKGIMHRDVKPGNVLISGGVAVVTDFGVAKAVSASVELGGTRLTSVGVALGTPAYMAPEQASGDPQIDHRADIYALGIVTYEMLAGRPPFWGRVTTAMLAAHVVEVPEPIERLRPAVPPMLASLVMQCLAKRAADRPQSADQVIHVLDTISTPTGGSVPTTVVMTPAVGAPHRRVRVLALSAAVAIPWRSSAAVCSGGGAERTPPPRSRPRLGSRPPGLYRPPSRLRPRRCAPRRLLRLWNRPSPAPSRRHRPRRAPRFAPEPTGRGRAPPPALSFRLHHPRRNRCRLPPAHPVRRRRQWPRRRRRRQRRLWPLAPKPRLHPGPPRLHPVRSRRPRSRLRIPRRRFAASSRHTPLRSSRRTWTTSAGSTPA